MYTLYMYFLAVDVLFDCALGFVVCERQRERKR